MNITTKVALKKTMTIKTQLVFILPLSLSENNQNSCYESLKKHFTDENNIQGIRDESSNIKRY